uniref:Putative Sgd1p n=1 Tax=Ganoderma lucidum TaxID=5315 RepID=A0A514YQR6_GANLU|nr:putative Sgd1p [Ganoderma lucidum]
MPARSHTGPSLPQSLLEEIKGENNSAHKHKRKGGHSLSRKETRKQARDTRKQRKAEYFSTAPSNKVQNHGKRQAEADHADSPQRKRAKLEGAQEPVARPTPANAAQSSIKERTKTSNSKASKAKTPLEKLAERTTAPKVHKRAAKPGLDAVLRTPQEEEEDAYISYLERKLGWVKGGKRTTRYGRGEDKDGLDDLLSGLDELESSLPTFEDVQDPESDQSDDFGDDESLVEGYDSDEDVDIAMENDDDDEADDDEENQEVEELEGEEWRGFGNGSTGEEVEESGDESAIGEDDNQGGTKTSQRMLSGSKYVPPHLRKSAEAVNVTVSEAQLKLTRQLKGLLNRMSEQNIASIVDGVEDVYRNNRRHDVTETLTKLITDGISSHSMLLDQYVVLHAAFISALHKLIGIEFAAFFVQHVVASYDTHFAALNGKPDIHADPSVDDGTIGKECSNLVVLLSELYNFQVISCVLVYDVIRALLDGSLTEFKVELLLKVVRNSGQQLRQDDPTALKSIIQIVHEKLPEDTTALSSRTRFMVETLSSLKNNKVKKAAGQTAGGEAVERMKKFLSGLNKKRHGSARSLVMSHEPLRVSLEDLRSADSKGRWWLVGAAWAGDPLVEHQQAQTQNAAVVPDAPGENALLKLAKKQGMNTDIRRSIFVVLMSSDDYVDACERLSQLKLTEVQQRETVRVILHCCGNEKQYNPYYALVGQQLCRLSHSHRITLQFCLWDFLREMGETTVGGVEILKNLDDDDRAGFNVKSISAARLRNVARAFGWWIAKDCCTLAILKPIDFIALKAQARTFMRELFVHVLANTQLATPLLRSERAEDLPNTKNKAPLEEVFVKGSKIQAVALGLMYFLRETFREEEGFLKWASQVALQGLRTGMGIIPPK